MYICGRYIQWNIAAAAAAKSLQSYPTLCDPIDGSPPGSPIPGILQARTLEWVAISFSNAWKWKVKVKSLSHVWLLATPWTAAYQASPSMGFSRQEYWSGVPVLLSHKNECIWISSNEVDEPRAYYTEWSKSERKKQISHTNAHIRNLERLYWWHHLKDSNGDTWLTWWLRW